jgi:hypothetical protein
MAEDHKAGPPFRSRNKSSAHPKTNARENDAVLLALQARFDAIAAKLDRAAVRRREHVDPEALTKEVEATLARLDPIERAIMDTPARTIVGLAVKARHAAYVSSEYWEAPIDLLEWDARAVHLLIEAVCDVARVPLTFRT